MKNILDAGPLVALINEDDEYHEWALELVAGLKPPFYSCREALAEAAAITGHPAEVVEMVRVGEIVLDFDLSAEAGAVQRILKNTVIGGWTWRTRALSA